MSGSDDLRVFCAIDTRDIDVAVSIADEVREHVRGVKLGLEFFGTYGPNGVRRFLDVGLSVFLDLAYSPHFFHHCQHLPLQLQQ